MSCCHEACSLLRLHRQTSGLWLHWRICPPNRKLTDLSRVLPSDCSATNQALIFLGGDEVVPLSVARHSGIPAISAVVTSRGFGCGCAMLRHFALEKGTGTLFVEGEHSTLNAQRATFKVQPRGWAGRQSGIEWRCQARYLGARGLRMAVPGSLSNGGVRLVIWFALEKGTDTLFGDGERSTLNAQRATLKVQPRGRVGPQSGIEWRCQARDLGARGLRMAVSGSLSNGGVRLVIWFALEKGTDTLFGEGERSTLNAQRATLKVQPRGWVGPQSGIEWRCQARYLGARGLRMAVSGSLSGPLEKGTGDRHADCEEAGGRE